MKMIHMQVPGSKNATLETTWLLTVDQGGSVIFYGKETAP